MDKVARLRIFAVGEFTAPTGWPEDVGVAVVSSDGIEVFPVHTREGGAEVLRRLSTLSGADLRHAPVHPPVDGHPPCDLPFSAVADLRSAVEDFLSRFPEAVEEADDFSVNFGYAVEEGIAFPALSASPGMTPAADAQVPAALPTVETALPGYLPPSDALALPRFSRPVLRVSAEGGLMVLLDPDLPALAATTPPVLLREDGMGLAVPVDALRAPDGTLRALRIPAGHLPWIPQGVEGEIPLVAVERGGYLLLSFLPEWAWSAPDTAQAEAPAAWQTEPEAPKRGWVKALMSALCSLWHKRLIGAAATSAIVVGVGLGMAQRGDAQAEGARSAAPVDVLRAGLFD